MGLHTPREAEPSPNHYPCGTALQDTAMDIHTSVYTRPASKYGTTIGERNCCLASDSSLSLVTEQTDYSTKPRWNHEWVCKIYINENRNKELNMKRFCNNQVFRTKYVYLRCRSALQRGETQSHCRLVKTPTLFTRDSVFRSPPRDWTLIFWPSR
jgi:hypothetical protein